MEDLRKERALVENASAAELWQLEQWLISRAERADEDTLRHSARIRLAHRFRLAAAAVALQREGRF